MITLRWRGAVGLVASIGLVVLTTASGGAQRRVDTGPAAQSTASAAGDAATFADQLQNEPVVCQGCTPPLLNRGGPVMSTGSGMTITPVYWSPSGFHYGSGYTDLITKFVGDVAAASGKTDNVFSVATEYSSIKYKFTAGDPMQDTNGYPAGGCTPKGDGVTACLTDAQVVAELTSLLSDNDLPGGLDHIYPVFFPPQVQVVDATGDYSVPGGDWCGEHSAVAATGDGLVYAEDLYPPADGGCGGAQSPNGNQDADSAVGILSHELIEAITDPTSSRAWEDSSHNEIGDECNQIYGRPLGTTDPGNPQDSAYNQVINGDKYYIQEEYSNASFASQGFAKGCVQGEGNVDGGQSGGSDGLAAGVRSSAPTDPSTDTNSDTGLPSGSPSDSSSDSSGGSEEDTTSGSDGVIDAGGDGYSLFLYGSPDQVPADQKSTTEVDANVTDGNGDAVKDDPIHFSVNALSGAGKCGKIDHADVHTDADGNAHVIFTAGGGDAICDVVGVEPVGGQSATSTIYQGAAKSGAPELHTTFPHSLTPGKQARFTTTYTNPSNKPMPNANLDLEIYGGEDNSPTTDAKQLTLTYSTHGDAGPFLPVALDGSTGSGDYIAASPGPKEGFTVAPHSTTTLTFHITAAANIPLNATLLDVESYLDQVDPASGSGDTLAEADPITVAVGTHSGGSSTGLIAGIGGGVAAVILAAAAFVIVRRRRARAAA